MLDVRIKLRLRFFDAHCPSCDGANLRPGAIRPWVENIFVRTWLLLSLRRPFICRDCDTRFYDFRMKARYLTGDEPEIENWLREYKASPLAEPEPEVSVQPDSKAQPERNRMAR